MIICLNELDVDTLLSELRHSVAASRSIWDDEYEEEDEEIKELGKRGGEIQSLLSKLRSITRQYEQEVPFPFKLMNVIWTKFKSASIDWSAHIATNRWHLHLL
jgi:hypothetical protein